MAPPLLSLLLPRTVNPGTGYNILPGDNINAGDNNYPDNAYATTTTSGNPGRIFLRAVAEIGRGIRTQALYLLPMPDTHGIRLLALVLQLGLKCTLHGQ